MPSMVTTKSHKNLSNPYYISSMVEDTQTLLQQEIDKTSKYITEVFNRHNTDIKSLQNIWDSIDYAIECSKIFYHETDLFPKEYTLDPVLRWELLCFKGTVWIRICEDGTKKKKVIPLTKSAVENYLCSTKESVIFKNFKKEFFKIR